MPTDDHVKVAVRIKPCAGAASCEGDTLHNKVVLARSSHGAGRRYTFDHVFDGQATNAELYESIGAPLLNSALDGYNATLLAYGQTGAGKTHTIMGQGHEDPGVVMRLVSQLFDAANKQGKHVQFSMLEIYNERIHDLFSVRRSSNESLRIREDPTTGPFVENLSWFVATDREAMQELLSIGAEARTVRSTHNNQHSSRAHTVVQIAITELEPGGQPDSGRSSMVCLVDLAGSERHDASGTVASVGPKTLREGCSINKSLTNLGLCISTLVAAGAGAGGRGANQSPRRLAALGLSPCVLRAGSHQRQISAKSHIPYRNSALTWLLRESIGGNSKTAILACVNPEPRHREESLSTLRFADRAKQLTTRVDRNGKMKPGASRAARRDRVLRKHGTFATNSDAQATIDALREEVRRLESTLQAHSADSGQVAGACLIPGGLITTVNGRKIEHNDFGVTDKPVTFKNGDRVTVWDPASQQEHAFLHLESTEAPKQQVVGERTTTRGDAVAKKEVQTPAATRGEAEDASSELGVNNSMALFLEAEEMARASRSRHLSLDSSLPLVQDRPLDQTEERLAAEVSRNRAPKQRYRQGQEERHEHTHKLHRRKKRQQRESRVALKTSAVPYNGSIDDVSTALGQERATASRVAKQGMALFTHSSSWAPCAVFLLGCGATVLVPSKVEDDVSELDVVQDGYSIETTEGARRMTDPMPAVASTTNVILDWAPSVIGALGWTALVYVLLRRWRMWLASTTMHGHRNEDRKRTRKEREPCATEDVLCRPDKKTSSHHLQHDKDRASARQQRYSDETARALRRRRSHQREANGCDREYSSRAQDQDRRKHVGKREEYVRRKEVANPEPAAPATDVKQDSKLAEERHRHDRRRHQGTAEGDNASCSSRESAAVGGGTCRNHSAFERKVGCNKLCSKVLHDATNVASRDDAGVAPVRSVAAHGSAENDCHRQSQREHRRDRRKDRPQFQKHSRDSEDSANPARNADGWKDQCCDALAV